MRLGGGDRSRSNHCGDEGEALGERERERERESERGRERERTCAFVSPQHRHSKEGLLGACRAAREQPSVSCVCTQAGEGRPGRTTETESERETETEGIEGGGWG